MTGILSFLSVTPVPMSDILDDVTDVVTKSTSWVSSFVNTITSNPLILLVVIMSLALFGIHIMKSLMSR